MSMPHAHALSPDPTATPRWPSPSLLWSLLAQRGGFTVDGQHGRPVEQGIAVAIDPAASFVFDFALWCDSDVQRWMERHGGRLGGGVHLGGWLDNAGRCWLDLVRVFRQPRIDHAVHIGQSMDQWAAFDLTSRSLICLRSAIDREPVG